MSTACNHQSEIPNYCCCFFLPQLLTAVVVYKSWCLNLISNRAHSVAASASRALRFDVPPTLSITSYWWYRHGCLFKKINKYRSWLMPKFRSPWHLVWLRRFMPLKSRRRRWEEGRKRRDGTKRAQKEAANQQATKFHLCLLSFSLSLCKQISQSLRKHLCTKNPLPRKKHIHIKWTESIIFFFYSSLLFPLSHRHCVDAE